MKVEVRLSIYMMPFWVRLTWPLLHTLLHAYPLNLDHISAWAAKWLWRERQQCQVAQTSHQLCQLPLRWHWTGRAGTKPRVTQSHCSHSGVPARALPHPHPRPGRGLLHRPHGNQSVDEGSELLFICNTLRPLRLYISPHITCGIKCFNENHPLTAALPLQMNSSYGLLGINLYLANVQGKIWNEFNVFDNWNRCHLFNLKFIQMFIILKQMLVLV